MSGLPRPDDFPSRVIEKIRYSDTDRQDHVNNIAFAVFLEAGRVEILFGGDDILAPGCAFVLARVAIDYRGQIDWPGEVEVCSRVERIGDSSIGIEQALFQNGACAATAEAVMVQLDQATGRAAPLSEVARVRAASFARR